MEVNNFYLASLLNSSIRFYRLCRREQPLAHHGIQRAGTNYINECLKVVSAMPVNAFNPNRSSCDHKHFRWQKNKETVPDVLVSNYGNNLFAETVQELNVLAKYPPYTNHIVVRKNRESWLVSILNFGLSSNWFVSKEEALSYGQVFLDDYDDYYAFWQSLEESSPGRVCVISIEDVLSDFRYLLGVLDQLSIKYLLPSNFNGRIDVVPMSPAERKKPISFFDVQHYF